MNRTWARLGGQLGLGFAAIGLLIIGLAWNGAASIDFVSGQIPYLLSGGAFGLGLIMIGGALIVVQNSRRDRAMLETQLRELNAAVVRLSATVGESSNGRPDGSRGPIGTVVVGPTSFHRPDCRLVQGKDLPSMSATAALEADLAPCRICNPTATDDEVESAPARRPRRTRQPLPK